MALTLRVWDEAIPGQRVGAGSITCESGAITARELIRSRVEQEVQRYNQSLPEVFQGLVQPEESERILNGFRMTERKPLHSEVQFRRACQSFESNGFLLMVDGRQIGDLAAVLDLKAESEIQFVKLVPLIGG